MQVAQLPDSHEKGGARPAWRAVCRIVVPGRCWVDSVRPSSSIVTRTSVAPSGGGGGRGGGAGEKRSTWSRAGVTPAPEQGALDGVHEGLGAAQVARPAPGSVGQRQDRLLVDEPLLVVEMVDHPEAVGVRAAEEVELLGEDHGGPVPIGVQQVHPPVGAGQGRLEEGENRSDPAPGGEGDDVLVLLGELEEPGGEPHLDEVAGGHVVAEEIGHEATRHPLHRDLELGVDPGRRGHGVAPDVLGPGYLSPDVHELAGPVGVRLAQLRWDIEHKRARLLGLPDNPQHSQGVIAQVTWGATSVRRELRP